MCIFAFTLKWAINLHLLFLRAGLCLTVCISPQDHAYLKFFAESYEKLEPSCSACAEIKR